jgi:sugar phosphate isomerase/epimerase
MRLGTTSFIYPADIMTNVRKLAGKVMDVELVIFECDDYGTNLPDRKTIEDLVTLGIEHDMSYTVHLPLDLCLADDAPRIEKAIRVIQCTRELSPFGFIVHLDGVNGGEALNLERWTENSVRSLDALIDAVGDEKKLCAENLDDQSPERMDAVLERTGVSCCIDLGHLWKQGLDPLPCLDRWLPRARVLHLHGIGKRDHKRLSLIPQRKLDDAIERVHGSFSGVVTLEVFNREDLEDSLLTFNASVRRLARNE